MPERLNNCFTFYKAQQNPDAQPEAAKTAGLWARWVILIGRNRHHLFILYYLLMDKESLILDICFTIFFSWAELHLDVKHNSAFLLMAVQCTHIFEWCGSCPHPERIIP